MDLPGTVSAWLPGLAVVLSLVAIALAALSLAGQRRVRDAYRLLSRDGSGRSRQDGLALLREHIEEVRAVRGEVAQLDGETRQLRELLRSSVSRVGTVRYDAFEEMGGRLSFSAALLDEHGDGVVITSINGRSETRTYAKPLKAGRSRHNLSTEEAEAVDRAQNLSDRTESAPPGGSAPDRPRVTARPRRPRRRRFLSRV